MKHTQRHIPLDQPLLPGLPDPQCMACVIVPARNEEAHLTRTLDALRLQHELSGERMDAAKYEVILLLNNCTDDSEEVALTYGNTHPTFRLHVVCRTLPLDQAHVGTARRLLMDTAYERLHAQTDSHCAILSTDGDTLVAPDWVAANLRAIRGGADVVGGVIHLFPEDLLRLETEEKGTFASYQLDREYQRLIAQLEALLDPDPSDPWPRHLEHFGASLACTPAIYALSGGLPPVKPLEDVAFIDALRKVGARIRHCPDTHIFTSARLNGRAEVGLSGQLRHWQRDAADQTPQMVQSAEWLEHRFRALEALRRLNESLLLPSIASYPAEWHERLATLHAERLPNPRFLELLDCNGLIEAMFPASGERVGEISDVNADLARMVSRISAAALATV